jgi:two-component system, OmpR family, response regulator
MKILLVEDDRLLSHGLDMALREAGYSVELSDDGAEADLLLTTSLYDLVVLDLCLPSVDGLEILKRFRGRGYVTPVLILTARDRVEDRVTGLDLGANDYLTKPFELVELEARIRALIRKEIWGNRLEIVHGNLSFNTVDRSLAIKGRNVELSARELTVLELLLKRMGRVVNKDQLLDELSGQDLELTYNALEIVIYRLRKKIESSQCSIRTLRGIGYILDKP